MTRVPYICGDLTELSDEIAAEEARNIYVSIANLIEKMFINRAFVPHEHIDPLVNLKATPTEVYTTLSERIRHNTSLLIVMAVEPSWGGGGEIQLANESNVPIIIFKPRYKNVSKYILGMPLVYSVIEYDSKKELELRLRAVLFEEELLELIGY